MRKTEKDIRVTYKPKAVGQWSDMWIWTTKSNLTNSVPIRIYEHLETFNKVFMFDSEEKAYLGLFKAIDKLGDSNVR